MTESEYTFVFFPYLKTSEPVHYRGLTIRNSDDLVGLPSGAIRHLETLRSMFFLRDHIRIKEMSCTFHDSRDTETSSSDFMRKLIEFQTLACFFYSTPHPTFGDPFLRYEHSAFYLFQPKRISKHLLMHVNNVEILPEAQNLEFDSRGEIEGYEGLLNNKSYFWVTHASHIFPPTVSLWLNISQDLSADLNYRSLQSQLYSPVFEYFTTREEEDTFAERILMALTWYNRSIEIDIDESVALVNLAIAFESLLGLESGKNVTDRFKEAVSLLVGGVPRLDSWLVQFYDARSQIVHEGRSANMMFLATDNLKEHSKNFEMEYRSLVSYGRQVFQTCVATIVTGATLAERLRLASLLVTNQQRLQRICQTLNNAEGSPAERILCTSVDVQEIENYRFVAEKGLKVEQLIGTAKLMIHQYLDSRPDESTELLKLMKKFSTVDIKDHHRALSLLKEVKESIEAEAVPQRTPIMDTHSIVATLIDSVWYYTFMYYFHLERAKKEKE